MMRSPYPADAMDGLRRLQDAQAQGFGSIAARWAPHYGSLLTRKYPGLFGAQGKFNPDYQTQLQYQAQQQRYQQLVAKQQARQMQGLRYSTPNYGALSLLENDEDDEDGDE